MIRRFSLSSALLLAVLFMLAAGLTWYNLTLALPRAQWGQALFTPNIDRIDQMLFHYSLLPRLAISLLVGAVGALVFGVAWGKRLSPVTLILAGLVVSLYCGAINQLLALFHHDQLQSMFLWSTGTLTQTDWSVVQRLWPQLLGGTVLTLLLLRPLTLMGLDDGVARNLGLALSLARLAALTLAIALSALLVNAVGIIGFIGLFAPLLAKMLGARRLLTRLMLAPLIGALILWLSDQVILWLTRIWMEVSTGSMTALIGAPLLLWLLPRLRSMSAPAMDGGDKVRPERGHVMWFALGGVLLLLLAMWAALSFGRDAHGWQWASGTLLDQLLPWRWPRIIAALTAGMMLAVAGCWASAPARRLAWC